MLIKILTVVELKKAHLKQMEIVRLYDVRSSEQLHGPVLEWKPLGLVHGRFVTDASDQDEYVLVEGKSGAFLVPTQTAYNIWVNFKMESDERADLWSRKNMPYVILDK